MSFQALSYFLAKENNSKDKMIQLLKQTIEFQEGQLKRSVTVHERTLGEAQQLRIEIEVLMDQIIELSRYAGQLERQNLRLTRSRKREESDSETEPEIETIRRRINYDTDEEIDIMQEQRLEI